MSVAQPCGEAGHSCDRRWIKLNEALESPACPNAGRILRRMLTVNEHVHVVHQIIQENVASESSLQFSEFGMLMETVLADRAPATNSLPWLMLPIFACEALAGDVNLAQHVAAALEIGRITAGCLDEWQDQDTDDALWRTIGPGRTVNLAVAMLPLSFLVLSRLSDIGVEPSLVLSLQQEFHRTLLQMCAGQDADLSDDLSLDDYEKVAGAKSGALFCLGCRAGAMVAGAPLEIAAQYAEFGYNLGVLAQMWNDFQGLAGLRGKGDAKQQRALPLLARQAVEAMQLDHTADGQQTGSLYALVQIQLFHGRAVEALARCPAAGQLTLFLDAYGTRHLVEKAQQSISHQERDDAR